MQKKTQQLRILPMTQDLKLKSQALAITIQVNYFCNIHCGHFKLFGKAKLAIGVQLLPSKKVFSAAGPEEHGQVVFWSLSAGCALETVLVHPKVLAQLNKVVANRNISAVRTTAAFLCGLFHLFAQPLSLCPPFLLLHGAVDAANGKNLHGCPLWYVVVLRHKFVCVASIAVQLPFVLIDSGRHQLLRTRPALHTLLVEGSAVSRHVRLSGEHGFTTIGALRSGVRRVPRHFH